MKEDINFDNVTIEDCYDLLRIGKRIEVNDGKIISIVKE